MKLGIRTKEMTKRFISICCMMVALMVTPTKIIAQEMVEEVDTLEAEEVEDYSLSVTQYELKDCDWIDICTNPKYAIVTKNGKKGIYDIQLGRNITEIEFDDIGYSRQSESHDSIEVHMFYAKKGIKCGILGVCASNNGILSIFMDDPDEVYSLDDCTTIDKRMIRYAKKLLEDFIHQQQMDNAQIVILDTKSGRLKTWIAMDADMEKEDAGKLLAHSCSASLMAPFYDRIPQKNRRTNATSPFMIAVGYNSLAHNGTVLFPTMKGDSVKIIEDVYSDSTVVSLRESLKVDHSTPSQISWLPTETEWLAYTAMDYIYDENDKEQSSPIGRQLQFAGLFPATAPRYTICIVANKISSDVQPDTLQYIVNPIVKHLLKRR